MKALFRAGVAVIAMFGASAFGSDLPVKALGHKPPIETVPYNWNGFYVGVNFGGGWSSSGLNIPGNGSSGGLNEFIGGVQAGYNFQAGHLLLGVEGEFDGAAFNQRLVPGPVLGSVSQHWISTVAGRAGLVDDRWLVFAKLGGGWVRSDAALNIPGGPNWTGSSTASGWLAGAGIEYGFKPNWTVKLEYDYLGLSTWTSATVPAVALNRDLQMVKAAISYKFESGVSAAAGASTAGGAGGSTEELAKQSQNPVASLVSVPFQSNTNFNSGPFGRTQEVFNIQPVVPMHLNENWNLISRTIIPLMSQPDPLFNSSTNGIGDVSQSLFLSPAHPGQLIWGAGPVFTIPSANDPILGTGRFLFGPTAVFLTMPGHWVIGTLINNQWSVGGNPLRPPVNSYLEQFFLTYNMAGGWFVTSTPIVTANWLAASGQKWTVPVGGGFGRVFKLGDQPVKAQIEGYYNAIRPTGASDWQLRTTFVLLFPEK
jgi:opacity protein-like surface antigen